MGKKFSPLTYLIIFSAIVCADRLTKAWALTLDGVYRVTAWLEFDVVYNRGIAWSMFHSHESTQFIAVSVIIAAIILAIAIHILLRVRSGHGVMGEVLVMAGALSNLADRIMHQGVVDFIVFTMGGWQWPVFNIADVCIVFGVGIMFFQNYKEL